MFVVPVNLEGGDGVVRELHEVVCRYGGGGQCPEKGSVFGCITYEDIDRAEFDTLPRFFGAVCKLFRELPEGCFERAGFEEPRGFEELVVVGRKIESLMMETGRREREGREAERWAHEMTLGRIGLLPCVRNLIRSGMK